MHGWIQGTNLCKVYNYHDSRACGYKWSVILPRIEGMDMEWFGFGYGMVMVTGWFWYVYGCGMVLD
jgi:hypothetical protein